MGGGLLLLVLWVAAMGWSWWRASARLAAPVAESPVATAVAASAPAAVTATATANAAAPAVPPAAIPPGAPPLMDLAELLSGRAGAEWRMATLRSRPAVMVIEFPNLQQQGLAMNRVAALLEKRGASRHQVLADAGLQALVSGNGDNTATFYLGHDYEAEGLARFFNLSRTQGVALNPQEQQLRQRLLQAGWLRDGGDGQLQAGGPFALITYSAPQADDPATPPDETMDPARREATLRHELGHGEYFTDPAYREHCRRFWRERLTEAERQMWRRYLVQAGYDGQNEDLMANETQAFLMHTPESRDFNAALLGLSQEALQGLRERFKLGLPPR